MVNVLLTPATNGWQAGKYTRYGMKPLYDGCALTVKRPDCRTAPELTVRHCVRPYSRCNCTGQGPVTCATEPLTGTTVPTRTLVFDGTAATTAGRAGNSHCPTM